MLSLDTILLGLIAAQAWREGGGWVLATACAACCASAPGWYAGGVLGGPVCALYLLNLPGDQVTRSAPWRSRLARAAVPLLGTVAFLAVSLPRTAQSIVHAEHYQGKTVFQAFDPVAGAANTLRTLADNQIIGAIGVYRPVAFEWPAVCTIDAVLLVTTIVWWKIVPYRRLVLVGLAIWLASDLLVYSARADWNYVRQIHRWTRYHLFPHFGLALTFVAGLPALNHRLFVLRPSGRLSYRQVAGLLLLIGLLALCHVSRTAGSHIHIAEATELMQEMDRIQAACRRAGISDDTARRALGFRQMPVGYRGDNAWELLRCSMKPRQISVEDAAVMLHAVK